MRKRKGLNSWVTFFDIQKHFDRLPRRFIWKSTKKCGVAEKMMRVVKSTLDGAKCVLHIDGETREVNMNDGSGQGTSLGPTLCFIRYSPDPHLLGPTLARIIDLDMPGWGGDPCFCEQFCRRHKHGEW
jgi:hypothetical protein